MNPEDTVIDKIDKLVDETMAAAVDRFGRPLDDYNADRYPRCDDCPHTWHGVGCVYCDCPGQNGEPGGYTLDQVEAVRFTRTRAATTAHTADALQDANLYVEVSTWLMPDNTGYTLSQLIGPQCQP